MSISTKIKLGLPFFDTMFEGIVPHRPVLIRGKAMSGTNLVVAQIAANSIRTGDTVIIFSSHSSETLTFSVNAVNVDLDAVVASGQLVLLNRVSEQMLNDPTDIDPLPFPEAFEELRDTLRGRRHCLAIFDSVLPWIAIEPFTRARSHIATLFNILARAEVTPIFTSLMPVSRQANMLDRFIREMSAVCFDFAVNSGDTFTLRVTKNDVAPASVRIPVEWRLKFVTGQGFVIADENILQATADTYKEQDVPMTPSAPTQVFHPLSTSQDPEAQYVRRSMHTKSSRGTAGKDPFSETVNLSRIADSLPSLSSGTPHSIALQRTTDLSNMGDFITQAPEGSVSAADSVLLSNEDAAVLSMNHQEMDQALGTDTFAPRQPAMPNARDAQIPPYALPQSSFLPAQPPPAPEGTPAFSRLPDQQPASISFSNIPFSGHREWTRPPTEEPQKAAPPPATPGSIRFSDIASLQQNTGHNDARPPQPPRNPSR